MGLPIYLECQQSYLFDLYVRLELTITLCTYLYIFETSTQFRIHINLERILETREHTTKDDL